MLTTADGYPRWLHAVCQLGRVPSGCLNATAGPQLLSVACRMAGRMSGSSGVKYYIAHSTALEVAPDEVALVERLGTTDQ